VGRKENAGVGIRMGEQVVGRSVGYLRDDDGALDRPALEAVVDDLDAFETRPFLVRLLASVVEPFSRIERAVGVPDLRRGAKPVYLRRVSEVPDV